MPHGLHWRILPGLVLVFLTLVIPSVASADWQYFSYSTEPPLSNSIVITQSGVSSQGTCVWHPPDSTPFMSSGLVESRQIAADYATCTEQVEIGTPAAVPQPGSGETSEAITTPVCDTIDPEPSCVTTLGPPAQELPNYSQGFAWHRVWWEDFVHIHLAKVEVRISWTWGGGGCIVGSTPMAQLEWHTASSWQRISRSMWQTTDCQNHRTHASAHFFNGYFCRAAGYNYDSHIFYSDNRVRGGYTGTYGTAITSTWATGQCLPFHWRQISDNHYWG